MVKLAILSHFKVYEELASGATALGCGVIPYVDAVELRQCFAAGEAVDLVLDINFHPEIWQVAREMDCNYAVWSFDSTVSAAMERIDRRELRKNDAFFLFNRADALQASAWHSQVFYLPFSAGPGFELSPLRHGFRYDVAFVMNSYDATRRQAEEDFRQRQAAATGPVERKLVDLAGQLGELVIERQRQIYDRDLIADLWCDLAGQCGVDPFGRNDMARLRFCRGLGQILSAHQREDCLRALGEAGLAVAVFGDNYWYTVTSDYPSLKFHGVADYASLPVLYNQSKVNINLTQVQNLDSVPQRIFHLLAAGGFVLTNGSPVLSELFQSGRQLVMFASPAEMVERVRYYLEHERARVKLAEHGHDAFMAEHRMAMRLAVIMSCFSFDGTSPVTAGK